MTEAKRQRIEEGIRSGADNDEIRNKVDGRLSDGTIDGIREAVDAAEADGGGAYVAPAAPEILTGLLPDDEMRYSRKKLQGTGILEGVKRLDGTERPRERPAEGEQCRQPTARAGKREEPREAPEAAEPCRHAMLADGTMLPAGMRVTRRTIALSGLFEYLVNDESVSMCARARVPVEDMERWVEEVACVAGICERLRAEMDAERAARGEAEEGAVE